jgi:hypothetical protein
LSRCNNGIEETLIMVAESVLKVILPLAESPQRHGGHRTDAVFTALQLVGVLTLPTLCTRVAYTAIVALRASCTNPSSEG